MLVLELKQHFKFPLNNFELRQEAGKAAPSAGSWSAGSWGVKQRHLELQVLSPAAQEQVSWRVKQLDFKWMRQERHRYKGERRGTTKTGE